MPEASTDPARGVWVWENPPAAPPVTRAPPAMDHRRVAAQLRAHPGQWLRLIDDGPLWWDKSINGGRLSAYRPAGYYEAKTLERRPGEFATWARYVGDRDA